MVCPLPSQTVSTGPMQLAVLAVHGWPAPAPVLDAAVVAPPVPVEAALVPAPVPVAVLEADALVLPPIELVDAGMPEVIPKMASQAAAVRMTPARPATPARR